MSVEPFCEFKILPIKCFKSPHFENKKYLTETTRAIKSYLKANDLNSQKGSTLIKICTGYIFNHATKVLHNEGYNIEQTKITGKLQDYVEGKFNDYIESLVAQYEKGFKLELNAEPTPEERRRSFRDIIELIKRHKDLLEFSKTGWGYFKRFKILSTQ
jgi:hypothetical protein